MVLDEKIKAEETFLLNGKAVLFEDNLFKNDSLNFIQVYTKGLPYFRASLKNPNLILKNFLGEMSISFPTFGPDLEVPLVKGDDYELVGLGAVSKAYSLDKKSKDYIDKYLIEDLYIDAYYDYRPELAIECSYKEYSSLSPNKQHFLDIIEYFDKGLIFLGEKNPIIEDIPDENDLPF
nr:hypothetical protein [Candidatus Woesearchaeota archaeon]